MGYMSSANTGIVRNAGDAVYNENSADQDFRIESDNQTHMLFVDAGNDRVGIGQSTPSAPLHVSDSGTGDVLIIESTDAGATAAPDIIFYRNSASVADSDVLGRIEFRGRNAANDADLVWGTIEATAEDATGGGEDGKITFKVLRQGAEQEYLSIGSIPGNREVVFNDSGINIDFRIEGSSSTNAFFVQGSNGDVGIGTNAPASALEVSGAGKIRQGYSVADPGAITLTAASHAGAYLIESANVTITLPATSTVGEQYCFIATHASGITIGRNGNNINGAASDETVAQWKAKTAVAVGSNNWVVIG